MSKAAYGQRGDKAQKRREREVIKLIAEENARGYGRDSWIADALNARGYKSPGGAAWSAMAVRRIIETPRWSKLMEKAIEARKPAPYNGCCGPDVDKHRPNVVHLPKEDSFERSYTDPFTGETKISIIDLRYAPEEIPAPLTPEQERQREEEQAREHEHEKQRRALIAAAEYRFLSPMDDGTWDRDEVGERSMNSPLWWHGYDLVTAQQHVGRLGLAGKDTWYSVAVCALVKELTERTGKDAHALLDAVEPPAVKAQLRRVVWGLMREIALQRQLNLAMRQAMGRDGERGLEKAARAAQDAMLSLDVVDGVWGA
jgi:hypothetical protein